MPGIETLPAKRIITLEYRSVLLKVTVNSVFAEVYKTCAAKVKEHAVLKGVLPPLLCEDALCTSGECEPEHAL